MNRSVFLKSEGDEYLRRNIRDPHVNDPVQPIIYKYVEKFDFPQVLEIGCGDGWRLYDIYDEYKYLFSDPGETGKYDGTLYGIDPSRLAIAETRNPDERISLQCGTADDLSQFQTSSMSIIVYGFCLYLCDKELLFRIANEADRVLNRGGYIIIYDFCPDHPKTCEYKHDKRVTVNKMNFGKMFRWHPQYTTIEHITSFHPNSLETDENKLGITVLKKK